MPDYRLTVYCNNPRHTETQLGPFIIAPQSSWEPEKSVAKAEGVFGIAVMELNRSHDQILATAMERGPDTFGLWTIASDVPASGLGMHRPRRKSAEMLTLFDEGPQGRVWIRLSCGLCSWSYERRMPEFCAQLDTLATTGIAAISLRSLLDRKS